MNIKPCAFCGSNEYRIATILDEQWYVECLDLDCAVFGPCAETEEEAIQKWNTRHYDDAPAYVRKLQLLQAELDKKTALYADACRRLELMEQSRNEWHEAYIDLEKHGYAITQDSTN